MRRWAASSDASEAVLLQRRLDERGGAREKSNRGASRLRLLRTTDLRPRDENLGYGLPKLHTSNVVHLVVNASPNSRVAGLLADGANEICVRREQVREDL